MMKTLVSIALLLQFSMGSFSQYTEKKMDSAKIPDNFKKENLVAWCIVPFDAMDRSPAERADMLVDLKLQRVAYDWREKHVAEFEDEILQYKKHGLEYFAFWDYHEKAFELFKKYDLNPQIWKTNPSPGSGSQSEKVLQAAEILLPLADKAAGIGSKFGLYNHGGWGGEPENLVAVCKFLRRNGFEHTGIVYNFHHAHENIETFEEDLEKMKPFLLCINLNGMLSSELVNEETHENKILPVGSGKKEAEMIRIIIESGYEGPIGILGHIKTQDVAVSLQNNIEGLENVIENLK